MKINFSKEHTDKILNYIERFRLISNEERQIYEEINLLQEQLNSLKAKLQSTESNLQSIRDDEKKYMEELHSVYGDFTLNDLWESIN